MILARLLRVMRPNDLIYCNKNREEGGWMMRGNEWNTHCAELWRVDEFFINSKGNLQCYVSER